jgi:chromosome segregation ATPase
MPYIDWNALTNPDYKWWAVWQRKHKEREANLDEKILKQKKYLETTYLLGGIRVKIPLQELAVLANKFLDENKILKNNNKILKNKNEDLNNKYDDLEYETEDLKDENEYLNDENEDLKDENEYLNDENEDLKDEIKKLKKENYKLRNV